MFLEKRYSKTCQKRPLSKRPKIGFHDQFLLNSGQKYCKILNQNTCCGYSKEPSQWDSSFEHPQHMLKVMGKKIFTISHRIFLFKPVLPSWLSCNQKILFLFLNQNICCGYSKEPSQWDGSFKHPKHMLKVMGKKIFTISHRIFLFKPVLPSWLSCNQKILFLFLNQNICCGYSKEPSQWDSSFEHPQHMLKVMGKKIFTISHRIFLFKPVLPSWLSCNQKILFLFLNQNICCGYSKEPSQWDGSFGHPKHMLKVMGKKIFTISHRIFLFKPVLPSWLSCNQKILFLFLNQNICCGYSKEPSQWDSSFEHPKHMLKIMGKKIFTISHRKYLFI